MKKLFTLLALMACFTGVKAAEIEDFNVDYTKTGKSTIGWKAEMIQDEWITADEDGLHLFNPEVTTNFYDYQLWIFNGASLEVDVNYTIKIVAKVSDASNGGATVRCRIGDWGGGIAGDVVVNSTDYQEYILEGQATVGNCGLLVQFGDYVGTVSFKSVTITHEGKVERPVEWVEQLTNGDAESAWPSWALEENDGVNINWRGDRAGEICAWALTMGKNNDAGPSDLVSDDRARPFPADIEAEEGNESNHVFAVHVDQINVIDNDANSIQWSNQFWIQSPKSWRSGTQIKLHFRYKAQKPVTVGTQIHTEHPSVYLHYEAIGDVNFTTEWQEFDKTITFNDNQDGGCSVAFNLTSSSTAENPQEPNIYYFDDLSWQTMKLDEGLFVAAANTATGIDYDFDNAVQMEWDEELGAWAATVGTVGNKDSWVNQVMISTVRGNDRAFKANTIKPSITTPIDGTDAVWNLYAPGSNAKVDLPGAGVWKVAVDENSVEVCFIQIEGDELVIKEPVDIVTNTTEVVVKGLERQPTAAEQPADEEAGIEAGTGQAWDNQFFIKANRALEKGEVTVLKFKYKSSVADAKTSTQCHGETPGAYMHHTAIGDVIFTNGDWQQFEKEFTVPKEADGMWNIAFNMAEIKEACDYYIKDVQWYLKFETEGKTMENLINAEGAENFYVKEGAGTDPYIFGTDPNQGINSAVIYNTVSTATYNLAGQRVANDYKGIVVKNGKKTIVK